MALIGLRIPEEISKKLSKISVSGKKEDPAGFHITMFYFDRKLKTKELSDIVGILHKNLLKFSPLKIKLKEIKHFSKNEDGFLIIVPIISNDLIELRKFLAKQFDEHNIKYSKKWPKYNPHLTLAYSNEEPEDKKLKEELFWTSKELFLYSSDKFEFGNLETGTHIYLPFGKNASLKYEILRLASFIFENHQLNAL